MNKPLNPTMTLAQIRDAGPCGQRPGRNGELTGWLKLLTGLGYSGKEYDPERVVSLGDIATTNDAADALWCVRCLDWNDIAVRRTVIAGAIMPAVRRASAHTSDPRVAQAIAELDRWCAGDDSVDLAAAEAARAAAWAEWAAAWAEWAAAEEERTLQRQDTIAAFPPVALPR